MPKYKNVGLHPVKFYGVVAMPGSSAEFPGPVIHKNLVPDNDENDAVPSSRRKVKRAISKKRTPSVKDSSTLKPAELEPLNDNVDGAKPSL